MTVKLKRMASTCSTAIVAWCLVGTTLIATDWSNSVPLVDAFSALQRRQRRLSCRQPCHRPSHFLRTCRHRERTTPASSSSSILHLVKDQSSPAERRIGERHREQNDAVQLCISHDGQSCHIYVRPDESILDALERQMTHVQRHLTSLPDLPSDCRRGNCLTCAAKSIVPPSTSSTVDHDNSIELGEEDNRDIALTTRDGLSPAMSRLVADKGYILTCSSYITRPATTAAPTVSATSTTTTATTAPSPLSLQLGEHDALWQEVYASPGRFTTPRAQLAARSAVARVLRQSAERNVPEWTRQTEQLLQQTPNDDDIVI